MKGKEGATPRMEKQALILATTQDFLWKFERENVRLLQDLGYQVHYAANMREPDYISDQQNFERLGVQAHHIDIARSPFMFQTNQTALAQLLELMEQYSIRLLHCHTPVGGLLGRLAGRRYNQTNKAVILYTAHGFHFYKGAPLWNRLVYRWVEQFLARYTDILIVINEEDYHGAQRFHLKKGGHLYKIPGVGLDKTRFHRLPAHEKAELRRQLGIGQDNFFFLSIGELNENKNHRVVLDALAKMKKEGYDLTKIRYGICGDGFFRERMKEWVKELGLEQTVILFGYRRDIPSILGCADASIFPSKREGLGMAGLESLAMGIPVIAADNRGTREYIEHGKNGFVCGYDDVDGFIWGMEQIQQLGKEKRMAMEQSCLNSVRPFDKRYVNAMMERIYFNADRRVMQENDEKESRYQRDHGRV